MDIEIKASNISLVASDFERNQGYKESLPKDSNKDIESDLVDKGALSDFLDASSDLGAFSDEEGYTEIKRVLDSMCLQQLISKHSYIRTPSLQRPYYLLIKPLRSR